MTLILTPTGMLGLLLSGAHQFEASIVFENRCTAAAEYFDTLFGIGAVAIGQVTDRPLRAIREAERDQYVVSAVTGRMADGASSDFDDGRGGQEHKQIDEVANLAEDAPSALLTVVDPMVGRQVSGIDAI